MRTIVGSGRHRASIYIGVAGATLAVVGGVGWADGPLTAPLQAESGPGGKDYPHASYRVSSHGKGNDQYWIFEPAEPAPAKPAPVVLFLHGWGAMDPVPYGAWVRHLVRRGNVVIYPRYQGSLLSPPARFTGALLGAVREAWGRLETEEGRVRPDRDRVAVAGHSFGGALSFNYVARAAGENLPVPKALMCLEPGSDNERQTRAGFTQEDPATIDAKTLVLMIVGEDDKLVGDRLAKRLWAGIGHVPAERKDWLVFRTDDHGAPGLVAGHVFPLAPDLTILAPSRPPAPSGMESLAEIGMAFVGESRAPMVVDALDWRGAWRLFDALTEAAFTGKGRERCLGGTPEQLDLGKWSDEAPVKNPVRKEDLER